MKRRVVTILFIICMIFVISFVSAAAIDEELHLNLQVIDGSGDVLTGTYNFTFNISTNSACNDIVYDNRSELTTDSRGIISHYLEDVNLNFTSQYWLCYYRDFVLIDASKMARTPYSFTTKNVSASGVINDSNINLDGRNITATRGLFYWLGSLANRITTLFVNEIDFTGNINGTGNVNTTGWGNFGNLNVSGTSAIGDVDFNGGWTNEGVSISGGDIYAQTLWVYNLSSLTVTSLSINGSLLPPVGFDDRFDIGASNLRWKDLYLGGQVYSNGTGDNWFLGNVGIGTGSPTRKLYVYSDFDNSGTLAGDDTSGIYINNDDFSVGSYSQLSFGRSGDIWAIQGIYNANEDIELAFIRDFTSGGQVESMRIDKDGNIGVGTDNPSQILELSKQNDYQLRLTNDYTGGGYWNIGQADNLFSSGGGKLLFVPDSTDSNSATVVFTNDGNVGIGTASPTALLHINGSASNGLSLNVSGVLYVNDTSGNVGIGTTAPDKELHVVSTENPEVRIESTGTDKVAAVRLKNDAQQWVLRNDGAFSDRFILRDATNTLNPFQIEPATPSNALYLQGTTGNVGIGTASPQSKLNIHGAGTTDIQVNETGNSVTNRFGVTTSDGFVGTKSNHNLRLITNNNAKMTILAGGNVGIGTESPSSPLQIDSNTHFLRFNESDGTVDKRMYGWAATTDDLHLTARDDAGTLVRNIITYEHDGNVGIGTDSPDRKLHIETADGAEDGITFQKASVDATHIRWDFVQRSDNEDFWFWGYDGTDFKNFIKFDWDNNYVIMDGGNVGIGTANPQAELEVASTNARFRLNDTNGETWQINTGTGTLDFQEIGSGRGVDFSIQNTTGNVGIGTTTPNSTLHIVSTSSNSVQWPVTVNNPNNAAATGTGGGIKFRMSSNTDGKNKWAGITSIGEASYSNNIGLAFYTTTSAATPTEKVRISNAGNVGIGTASPVYNLVVAKSIGGELFLKRSSSTIVAGQSLGRFMAGGDDPAVDQIGAEIRFIADGTWGTTDIPSRIEFFTVPDNSATLTSRMTIDSTGNVGIGIASPTSPLHVMSGTNAGVTGLKVVNEATPQTALSLVSNTGTGTTFVRETAIGDWYMQVQDLSAVAQVQIHSNSYSWFNGGNVGIGTNIPNGLFNVNGSSGTRAISGGDTLNKIARFENSEYLEVLEGTNQVGFMAGDGAHILFMTRNGAVNYEKMRIESTGNVGIGTTNPVAKFHVNATSITGTEIKVSEGNSSHWSMFGMGTDNNVRAAYLLTYGSGHGTAANHTALKNLWGDILFFTGTGGAGNTEKMRITSDGNVSIGTTSPAFKLHVKSTTDQDGILLEGSGSSNVRLVFNSTLDSSGGFAINHNAGDILVIQNTTTAGAYKSNIMAFDHAGNVGIGTLIPATELEVDGDIGIGRVAGGYTFRETVGGAERAGMHSNAANDLIFNTGGATERMRMVEATGRVGIGLADPEGKLHVSTETSGDANLIIEADTDNNNEDDNPLITFRQDGAAVQGVIGLAGTAGGDYTNHIANAFYLDGSTNNNPIQFATGAAARMTILQTGEVGIGTASPTYELDVYDEGAAGAGSAGIRVTSNGTLVSDVAAVYVNTAGAGYGSIRFTNKSVLRGEIKYSHYGGTSDSLKIRMNSADLFTFKGSGELGIGTTNPSQKLNVVGNANFTGNISSENFKTDVQNTSVGRYAATNATGRFITAIGSGAALSITGDYVTAIGKNAAGAYLVSPGDRITAVGQNAAWNSNQDYVTAIGMSSASQSRGEYLTVVGYKAGYEHSVGDNSTFVGSLAGAYNNQDYATGMGMYAGYSNSGGYLTATGYFAGYDNSGDRLTANGWYSGAYNTGDYLVSMGMQAGKDNDGVSITAIGNNAGMANNGNYATFIGADAGYQNKGNYVTAIGSYQVGYQNKGNYSTFVGYMAGHQNGGNNVVAIGYQAGLSNTVRDQFIIRQANVESVPLIQGNFSSGFVGINTTSPSATLHVVGTVNFTDAQTEFYNPNSGDISVGTLHILSSSNRPEGYLATGTSAASTGDVITFDASSYVPTGAKAIYIQVLVNTDNTVTSAVLPGETSFGGNYYQNHSSVWTFSSGGGSYQGGHLIVLLNSSEDFRLRYHAPSTIYYVVLEGYYI